MGWWDGKFNLCVLIMFCFPDELKACHILDVESINGIIFVYTNKNQFIFQMFDLVRKTHTYAQARTHAHAHANRFQTNHQCWPSSFH